MAAVHRHPGDLDAPDVCIERVSHLLNQWFLETAPLVFSAVDDEPREQWFLVQSELHDVQAAHQSPRRGAPPAPRLGAGRVDVPATDGSQRLHRPCAQRAEPS